MSTKNPSKPSATTSMTTSPSKLEVVNKYHGHSLLIEEGNFYIGRGSPVGNPYTVEEYGRSQAIDLYKLWLNDQIAMKNSSVLDYLDRIATASVDRPDGARLVCFCSPRACHGEIIKHVINERMDTL